MKISSLLILLPLFILLSACGEEETGPVSIHYEREACERCRMIISDAKFVVQVRGGEHHKVWKFDDMGDAVIWLQDKPWADDPKTEIWVMDYANGTDWLDARQAHFVPGFLSPMAYGFGAFKQVQEKSVDFNMMKKMVLKREISINCEPSKYKSHDEHDAHEEHDHSLHAQEG